MFWALDLCSFIKWFTLAFQIPVSCCNHAQKFHSIDNAAWLKKALSEGEGKDKRHRGIRFLHPRLDLARIRLTSGISGVLQICAQSWKSATQDHFLASSDSSIEQAGESGYLTRPPSFPSFTAVRKKLFIHSSQYIAGDRPKPKRAGAGERCKQCLWAGSGARHIFFLLTTV